MKMVHWQQDRKRFKKIGGNILANCENPEETFEWTPIEPNNCECQPPTSNEIKQIKGYKYLKILKSLDEETVSEYSVIDRV